MARYESWCPRCRVTHPPERQQCVHCGGRTVPGREAAARARRRVGPAEAQLPDEQHPEPPDLSEGPVARPLRIGMTVVWLGLALVAAAIRICQEGGSP